MRRHRLVAVIKEWVTPYKLLNLEKAIYFSRLRRAAKLFWKSIVSDLKADTNAIWEYSKKTDPNIAP